MVKKKKDNSIKDIISLIISFLMLSFVAAFGFLYIKDAASKIGIMEKGYRNLCQVNVYADVKNGRGFIIRVEDDYMDIVTSKHLVSENNKVSVEFGNKGRVDGEVVYYYRELDAAVVRVQREDFEYYIKGAKEINALSKGEYDSIPLNKKVICASNIYDTELEVSEGRWYSSDEYIPELGCSVGLFLSDVKPGMSGGAIFDEEERFAGMIIASNDSQGAVIPSYEIMEEYIEFSSKE